MRIANDSEYGLAGSVWTADIEQGMDIARRVRTGTYGVNQYTMDFIAPFGGYKASGIGREFGREGLEHYLELKSIVPPSRCLNRDAGAVHAHATRSTEIVYDPYDYAIDADPHPVWKRMRDEAPVYWNEQYQFWALSRFADVYEASRDIETFSSARGTVLELIDHPIEAFAPMIFQDPPYHTVLRALVSRAFTPRRIASLEARIRELVAEYLDPWVGGGELRLRAGVRGEVARDGDRLVARCSRGRSGHRAHPDRRDAAHRARRDHDRQARGHRSLRLLVRAHQGAARANRATT